jgi:hypothetical protein
MSPFNFVKGLVNSGNALGAMLAVLLLYNSACLPAQAAHRARLAGGTEAGVRATYYREKSTYFRFDHLRAGVITTAKGWWNVQDFADSFFNPNAEEITVNLKMTSDDPKFVFTNGQIGIYTKQYHLKPLFGVTDNIYIGAPFVAVGMKPDWPVPMKSNFIGSVEVSGAKPFYFYILHETPEGVSPDLVYAYHLAWDPCEYDEPAVWDNDLNKFVIQYTNYWHDQNDWRVGWFSTLEIRNNADRPITYTLDHIPYYGGQYDPGTQQVDKYKEQVVHLTLQPHEMKKMTLMKLFGWGDKMTDMEGCLLITPSANGAKSGTSARLLIVPNNSGEPLHAQI